MSDRMHRPSGNHMESILYRKRACISQDDATQRDATGHGLRRNVTLASVQYPRSSSSSRAPSSLSLNRVSRKIHLETVTIIRAVADAVRRDGYESFCVGKIVSRPFHGRSARPNKFFKNSTDATRGKPSLRNFSRRNLARLHSE